jgi:hypothetical protein
MHPSGWRKKGNHASIFVAIDGRGQKHGSLLEEFVEIPEELGGGGDQKAVGGIIHVWELIWPDGSNFTGAVGGLAIADNHVWTTDDTMIGGLRNNLIAAFSLTQMLDDLQAQEDQHSSNITAFSKLEVVAEVHVDAHPTSLFYDSTPGKEMMWVAEYSMDAKVLTECKSMSCRELSDGPKEKSCGQIELKGFANKKHRKLNGVYTKTEGEDGSWFWVTTSMLTKRKHYMYNPNSDPTVLVLDNDLKPKKVLAVLTLPEILDVEDDLCMEFGDDPLVLNFRASDDGWVFKLGDMFGDTIVPLTFVDDEIEIEVYNGDFNTMKDDMIAELMGSNDADYKVDNYHVPAHHIGHKEGLGWAVGYNLDVLKGRLDPWTYQVGGQKVLVPDHVIPVGPFVRGFVKIEMFATHYVGLLRCSHLKGFMCRLEFFNMTEGAGTKADPDKGCMRFNGEGIPITEIKFMKRSLAVPNGGSDLTVGLTGLELYLTHESASLEWKKTMEIIKGDPEDRVFMMRVPQTGAIRARNLPCLPLYV